MFCGKESNRTKPPKMCSMGHASVTGVGLARLGAVALTKAHTVQFCVQRH